MAIQEKYIVHYRPESRTRQKGTIIIRKSNDPMLKCEEQIGSIYDQACRLLNTVKVWKENSFDDDLTNKMLVSLKGAIDETLSSINKEVNSIITEFEITDENDKLELLDVVAQLYEQADAIFDEMEV